MVIPHTSRGALSVTKALKAGPCHLKFIIQSNKNRNSTITNGCKINLIVLYIIRKIFFYILHSKNIFLTPYYNNIKYLKLKHKVDIIKILFYWFVK